MREVPLYVRVILFIIIIFLSIFIYYFYYCFNNVKVIGGSFRNIGSSSRRG